MPTLWYLERTHSNIYRRPFTTLISREQRVDLPLVHVLRPINHYLERSNKLSGMIKHLYRNFLSLDIPASHDPAFVVRLSQDAVPAACRLRGRQKSPSQEVDSHSHPGYHASFPRGRRIHHSLAFDLTQHVWTRGGYHRKQWLVPHHLLPII